ncbi:TPA: hypothetical protein RUX58_000729 [Aeromonas dhakensis]|nr:hypothetical protein [Aeromonas dhakensis]
MLQLPALLARQGNHSQLQRLLYGEGAGQQGVEGRLAQQHHPILGVRAGSMELEQQ